MMTKYPNGECEKHRDVKTDSPVCIVCMAHEIDRLQSQIEDIRLMLQSYTNGYWCLVCGRYLLADKYGVVIHDNIPHPENMTFEEEPPEWYRH